MSSKYPLVLSGSSVQEIQTGDVIPFDAGGTGNTSYTDGQLLIGNTSTGGLTKATITAGSNITITNGNGSIEISAAGSSGITTGKSIAMAMIFGF